MTERSALRSYPPQHLSSSSVDLLTDCGKLWYGKYARGVQEKRGDGLMLGAAFDGAVEWALRRRWDGHWVTAEELAKRFVAEWDAGLARPGEIDWGTRGQEGALQDGLTLCQAPATLAALRAIDLAPHPDNPDAPGLQVEVKLAVPGVSVPVIGFVDVLAKTSTPSGPGTLILDVKTARRAWNKGRERKELQARIYAAALWQAGAPFPTLSTGYWVFIPGMTPEACRVQRLDPALTERDVLLTMDLLRRSWRQIEAGTFVGNPHSWRCTPRCPLWSECYG